MNPIILFFKRLKENDFRFFALLTLVVISLPLNMHVNAYCIALFSLNTFLSVRKIDLEKNRNLIFLYVAHILFFTLLFISVFYSENTALGLTKMETKLSFLLLPLSYYLGLGKLKKEQLNFLKQAFVLSVVAAVILCFIESLIKAGATMNLLQLQGSMLSNPLMHRGYLSVFIGISILLLWESKNIDIRYKVAAISLLAITITLLQGRMNILALLLVVLVYFLIQAIQYKNGKIPIYLGVAILLIIILFQAIPKKYNRFNQPLTFEYDLSKPNSKDFTGITTRLALWQHAIPLIKQQPFFGYGIGDTPEKRLEEYHKTGFVRGISQKYNCHNQYLESTLAAGIFASLILILILTLYIIQGLKGKNPYLVMVVVYFFLSMLTESLLERHWGVTTFTVLLPILYKETLLKKEG